MEKLTENFSTIFKPDMLNNRVAFVTGGGSGIGFTISEYLIRHGCHVIISSRNEERLQQAASLLNSLVPKACSYQQMDVRKIASVEAAVKATVERFGKIDILVNGAAGNFICPLDSMSYNAFRTVLEIDTMGVFNVSKAVYNSCMKANGGVIVNISACLHYRGTPAQAHAGAAKAAIDALTRHMAVEWGSLGIRVVGVAPGPIRDTEGMRRLAGKMETTLSASIPLRRLGTRQDIAEAILYLVSPAASYVTAETLVVDGGDWVTHGISFDMFSKL